MKTFQNVSRATALLVFVQLGLAQVSLGEDKPVHIFILSGQSNMAGMNPKLGFEDEAAKLFPDAEVQYFKVARGGQPTTAVPNTTINIEWK